MDYKIFDKIEFEVDAEKIIKKMKLTEKEDKRNIKEFVSEANKIAKPKIAYSECIIEKRTENEIMLCGTVFKSKLLVENTKDVQKVYPYVITCGREIFEWAKGIDGFLERYFAEEIKIEVLQAASKYFDTYMKKNHIPNKASSMNPGSLKEWPINEQKKMFELMKEPAEIIGVELTDSFLMMPDKSISGIMFEKEKTFVNCMLCDRENCPDRRAKYKRKVK